MKALTAQELRIGNYINDINHPERECQVFRLTCGTDYNIAYSYGKCYEDGYANDKLDQLQPIPLTEEWLLKFGWNYHKSEDCVYYSHSWGKNGMEIIVKDYHYKGFELELGKARFKSIEYVHQLQNLYFALTGNELTIR
jgi:hypothetical protein